MNSKKMTYILNDLQKNILDENTTMHGYCVELHYNVQALK